MNRGEEVLSLWIGPDSQKLAHHFYALQAEQFYDDLEDPTNQHALWNFKDKQMEQKFPRMLIFDTISSHLTRLRKVNHKKMIKKLQQPSQDQMFFSFQFVPQDNTEQEEEIDPEAYLFENWRGTEENYVLIDKKFHVEKLSFDSWENLYRSDQDKYEDRIRKQLEKSDFMRVFTVCSDGEQLGFTHQLIEYLRDECPKKPIVMCNVADPKSVGYFRQSFLPLMGSAISDVDILVDFDKNAPQFDLFQQANYYTNMSSAINSLFTPFILKDSNSVEYLQRIDVGNRALFNLAYTLPIINEESILCPNTNIFEYIPSPVPAGKKSDKVEEVRPEDNQNRINFVNSTMLNILNPPKPEKKYHSLKGQQKIKAYASKVLTESYVIKGHFDKFQKTFNPKTSKCSVKYLEGILSLHKNQNLKYSEFYRKDYGVEANQYPFHTVLFQHAAFGPSIRNFIRRNDTFGNEHELVSEWKQNAYSLSDSYEQQHASDSD